MGTTGLCKVCRHPDVAAIDQALSSRSAKSCQVEFGISIETLRKHIQHRLDEPVFGGGGDATIRAQKQRVMAAAARARDAKDIRGEMAAIREWRALDEHEVRANADVNQSRSLTSQPAFLQWIRALVEVIAPCPTCSRAVGSMPGVPAPGSGPRGGPKGTPTATPAVLNSSDNGVDTPDPTPYNLGDEDGLPEDEPDRARGGDEDPSLRSG